MSDKTNVQWFIGIIIALIGILIGLLQIQVVRDMIHPEPGWLCCYAHIFCEKPQRITPPDIPGKICWVAYSPTHYNPDQGLNPNEADVREDLKQLKKIGFKGLVTYTAKGILGGKLPTIAQEEGFEGLIVGIWEPFDADELHQAEAAARFNITKGFVMGNEGLYPKGGMPKRYTLCRLRESMNVLRRKTNKPVTTSEDSAEYAKHPELWELGDWIFPNAHPYWAGMSDPISAVNWTRKFFNDHPRGSKPVVLKEVGLPTVGGIYGPASEASQAQYYALLGDLTKGNRVNFVYFEAFDQTWKGKGNGEQVERSWGVCRSDRRPKAAGQFICGQSPPPRDCNESAPTTSVFYVYKDAGANNHFYPTGPMGDIGDLKIDQASRDFPYQGSQTALRIDYTPRGKAPNACNSSPPCNWTGMRWQYPPQNFGDMTKGYDLRGFRWLRFAARSDSPVIVEFGVGGIDGKCRDSILTTIELSTKLTPDWQEYAIDLSSADLHHVIGGFSFAVDWPKNKIEGKRNQIITFYVDEVRFER